jgi:hypothetical protein
MLRKVLNQRNPCSDPELFTRYRLLYTGGKQFKANVGKFLLSNPQEPPQLYEARKREAFYEPYVGGIGSIFSGTIMTAPMSIRAVDAETHDPIKELDDFYATFKEDVDAAGTDLTDFFRARFEDALISKTAWFIARLPTDEGITPETKADWEARGLGRAALSPLDACQVLDWLADDVGRLQWVIVYSESQDRLTPAGDRSALTQSWFIYDAENCIKYSRTYRENEIPRDDDEIPLVATSRHGFTRVPVIRMSLPDGLWLLDRVADAQIEHFRLKCGLHWAIRRSCYPIPVFKLQDADKPPRIEQGSAIILSSGDEHDFLAPPPGPLEMMAGEVQNQKDELFRVSGAMLLATNTNSPSALGRSGESKSRDESISDKNLLAYASIIRLAIENTYELISDARGDTGMTFSVEGLSKFNLHDAKIALEDANVLEKIDVPSPIFLKELAKKVVDQYLPDLDKSKKDEIDKEIDDSDLGEEPDPPPLPQGLLPGIPAPDPINTKPQPFNGKKAPNVPPGKRLAG